MNLPATPLSTLFILGVLALMGALIYKKVNVLWVLLAAALAVLVLFWVSPLRFLKTVVDPEGPFLLRTGKILLLVYLINLLGTLLRNSGQEKTLVSGLDAAFGDRKVMAAFSPMAMGLLPMPGGALLSASMVEMTLEHQDDAGHKAAINLWFRHVWELVDPLYPAVILSSQIAGMRFGDVVLANWTTFWAMIFFGAVLLLRKVAPLDTQREGSRLSGAKRVGGVLLPIAVAFGVTFLDKAAEDTWFQYLTGPLPGVTAGVITAVLLWRVSFAAIKKALRAALEWKMLSLIVFALLLATSIEVSGAVDGMKQDLNHYHLPVILIISILPFFTGFLTGLGVGFASMTLPLVVGLAGEIPGGMAVAFPVAYASGFIGLLFSPVHLCVLLSVEKFKTDLGSTYKWMIPCGIGVAAVVAARAAAMTWGPDLLALLW